MAVSARALRRAAIAAGLVALAIGADLAMRSPWFQRLTSGGPGPVPGTLAPPPGTIPAEPELKIAFLGDSGAGPSYQRVLELVKREGARAVVHMGDAVYEETPARFWGVVDRILGHDYPYFLAQGNHDTDGGRWPEMAVHGWQHFQNGGAVTEATGLLDPRLAFVFRGVSLLFLGQRPNRQDPAFIRERFSRDEHIWKVCAWHKNQNKLQVGGKDDEMGWGVYESCRQMGALIETGHEHSYQRTRTLASMVEQRVDPSCGDAHHLCVRPGAVPVFVSGLGGKSIRDQERCLPATYPYGCHQEWAFIYTSNQRARYGAVFIVFHTGGDPRKAEGYFKTIDGEVVDRFDLRAQ